MPTSDPHTNYLPIPRLVWGRRWSLSYKKKSLNFKILDFFFPIFLFGKGWKKIKEVFMILKSHHMTSPRLGWSHTLLIHSPRPPAARSTAVRETFWNNTIPLQHTEEWLLPPRRGLHHRPPRSPDPTPNTAVGQTGIRPTLGKRWTAFVPTIARLFMLDFLGGGGWLFNYYCSDASQSSIVLCRIDTKVCWVPFHSIILFLFTKGLTAHEAEKTNKVNQQLACFQDLFTTRNLHWSVSVPQSQGGILKC